MQSPPPSCVPDCFSYAKRTNAKPGREKPPAHGACSYGHMDAQPPRMGTNATNARRSRQNAPRRIMCALSHIKRTQRPPPPVFSQTRSAKRPAPRSRNRVTIIQRHSETWELEEIRAQIFGILAIMLMRHNNNLRAGGKRAGWLQNPKNKNASKINLA